jgi:DCC1-like thiol-disulfide oxidoreductase
LEIRTGCPCALNLGEERNRSSDISLIYDGECPVCSSYCNRVRIQNSLGTVKLVNAREVDEITVKTALKGLDLDQGMVLKVGDVLYFGPEAINAMALMSSKVGPFNKLNHWIFRSRRRSTLLYPVLRNCRNMILRGMRKAKINDIRAERDETGD